MLQVQSGHTMPSCRVLSHGHSTAQRSPLGTGNTCHYCLTQHQLGHQWSSALGAGARSEAGGEQGTGGQGGLRWHQEHPRSRVPDSALPLVTGNSIHTYSKAFAAAHKSQWHLKMSGYHCSTNLKPLLTVRGIKEF